MEKLSIGKLNFGNFGVAKPVQQDKKQSAHSNPFGINFKGSVIAADVFESTKEKDSASIAEKASEKTKLFTSAIVGNINSFNSAFKSRINSVISFGKKVQNSILQSWETAKNTRIEFDFDALTKAITSKFDNTYNVNHLVKQPVGDIEQLWLNELQA